MKILLVVHLLCIIFLGVLFGQSHESVQEYNISTDNLNTLHIHNRDGAVFVRGTDGDRARLKITRRMKSASKAQLERAQEEVYIDTIMVNGDLYFFIEAPDRVFKITDEGDGYYDGWHNRQNKSDFRHFKLDYSFTWEVEIPNTLDLHASTHRKNLTVENVSGAVVVENHHDDLELTNLSGDLWASTHHGDVNVSFIKNPANIIECDTHHGDIRVQVQEQLSADVTLNSHHGSFYTDFDWETIPYAIETRQHQGKTRYRWGKGTQVRIGDGGLRMDFNTHHGDVYVTK